MTTSIRSSIGEKQVALGDAEVPYGDDEQPKYAALRKAINDYYRDLLRPLTALRDTVFTFLPIPDPRKAEEEAPFRYLARHRRILDEAIDLFLAEMAGPDRTRKGFVSGGMESDTPDGIIQQRDVFTHAIGVQRAGRVMGLSTTVTSGRHTPAVRAMLDHAFDLLSENGKMRLERVRDQIHGILVSATDAGLSPLETARQLSRQFDHYSKTEFQRLARTESAFAAEAGSRQQYREFGVTHVQWVLSAGACVKCEEFRGKVIPIEDVDDQPPEHPNCLCSTIPVGAREPEE